MHTGAIAVLDALGFKGIWQKYPPDTVLRKLKLQRQIALSDLDFLNRLDACMHGDAGITSRWVKTFSDTIVVGCIAKPAAEALGDRGAECAFLALAGTCSMVSRIAASSLGSPTPGEPNFTFRGSIAYGDLAIEEEFMIGPAIDEAAESYEAADGAFVWLCPSAASALHNCLTAIPRSRTDTLNCDLIRDYAVPLRGGRRCKTFVVNPLGWALDIPAAVGCMLGSFDSPGLGVAVKKQNTEEFLRHAARLAESNPLRGVTFATLRGE